MKLIDIILESRKANNDRIGSINASSAITLLNYSGYQFIGYDFSNVNIPFADLTGSKFENINLSGANCYSCKFGSSTLINVNFANSNLNDCYFGELTLLKSNQKITSCAFS